MDWITITEYAAAAHISKQAAYKRAKNSYYKGYFRKISGVLMVDSALLELNQIVNQNSTVENETAQAAAGNPVNGVSTEFSTVDKDIITLLKERLEIADKQIDSLNKKVDDLLSIVAAQSEAIANISHEHNLLEAGKIQAETMPPPSEDIPIETESKAETGKKGFFSRFRRR